MMLSTRLKMTFWNGQVILLVCAVILAACSPRQAAVRPTPTFILDGPGISAPPTAAIVETATPALFLPVVSGQDDRQETSQSTTAGGEGIQSPEASTRTSTPADTPTPRPTSTPTPAPTQTAVALDPSGVEMRFAVVGSYGSGSADAIKVANMLLAWEPDLIITTGDNNLPSGSVDTIDRNIGQLFHTYLNPYSGDYGGQADTNRFFPVLSSHDWISDSAQPFFDFFTLPGNERYYQFTYGPAAFFALDSDSREPDGNTQASTQAEWLREALSFSSTCWQFVYTFDPPYSSGQDGSSTWMQWPYAAWGADAVFSGHDRHYERLELNNTVYFVNGLGGSTITPFSAVQDGSKLRYNDDYGAMLVTVDQDTAIFEFYNSSEELIDYFVIDGGCR